MLELFALPHTTHLLRQLDLLHFVTGALPSWILLPRHYHKYSWIIYFNSINVHNIIQINECQMEYSPSFLSSCLLWQPKDPILSHFNPIPIISYFLT
jgi:hypothetical protein